MQYVRSWHLADVARAKHLCPLVGVKRTSRAQAPTSAFDPQRTFRSFHAQLPTKSQRTREHVNKGGRLDFSA
jgi:hypothetical protein